MSIIEKIEKKFNKKIPCILKDEEGNNWAAHGLILAAYNEGYNEGKQELAVTTPATKYNYGGGFYWCRSERLLS